MSGEAAQAACHYCGLPVPGRRADEAEDTPQYCCFGCRFAEAVTQERGDAGHARWTLTRLGLAIFFTMTVMVFTLALWTRDVYLADGNVPPLAATLYELFRYICLLFALPVLLLLGGPLVENAAADLRRLRPTTDVLLLSGIAAAFAYSLASTLRGDGHVYFEVVCMVLVAVTLGRWFEATGRLQTSEALRALEKLLPDRAHVIRDEGEQLEISPEQIAAGDRVRVLAGERIPVDGRVLRNRAMIDQQVITGESQPVLKQTGDDVFSGTLNLDGDLLLEATTAGDAGTLKSMAEAVASAASHKERYQRLADRAAAWFLPAVALIALATLAWHGWRHGLDHGLLAALAVVLIACPCALALATPMSFWAAIGRASRGQVLIRDGDVFSRLREARVVCFDKTGTLTTGRSAVERFTADSDTPRDEVLATAASLAASSRHELARAIVESSMAEQRTHGPGAHATEAHDVRLDAGRGVHGDLVSLGQHAYLGSARYMEERGLAISPALEQAAQRAETEALSLCCVGWGGRVRGVFTFREELRPEAKAVLDWCRRRGLMVTILTGDHRQHADALSRELGDVAIEAELLPADKLAAVERLRREHGVLVMIGDGVNDAPSLAAADVGVALGSGADVSRSSGDVCLLSNDLARIPWLFGLAQRTVAVVRWNLLWAFLYNAIGVALAAAGLLNPIVAAIAMVVSSLLVVSNSLRLAGATDENLLDAAQAGELKSNAASGDAALESSTDSSPAPPRLLAEGGSP